MRKLITTVFLTIGLSACAVQSGNYAALSEANNKQIAADTVKKLTVLYPPASTHIFLSQAVNDPYGQALEKKLRESGYAVEENTGLSEVLADLSTPESTTPAEPQAVSPSATHMAVPVLPVTTGKQPVGEVSNVALSYIIDPIENGLYRVTLTLDSRVLSRVYLLSKKRFGPAGAWALKE